MRQRIGIKMEDMNDSVVHILQKVPVETQTIPAMSGQRAMAGGQNLIGLLGGEDITSHRGLSSASI